MPRKKEVKWLTVARADLTKCHNKRCEEPADQDYLCSNHWVAWQNNGRLPAMPGVYSGERRSTDSPLQVELATVAKELDLISSYVAKMRADDRQGLAELEEARQLVDARIDELKARHHEALAPFVEAQAKTSSWFDQVGRKAEKALSLIETRTHVARSSIRPTLEVEAVTRRRTIVNPGRKVAQ